MNTPTPTEAHRKLCRDVIFSATDGAELIADSEAKAVAAKVSSLTCTHHNDAMRAACPVCLVTTLTAERDQLRAEVERLKTCGIVELAAINSSVPEYCKHWEARTERAEAEVKMLGLWREGVIENAWAHKANLEGAIARAERAEAELATERDQLRAEVERLRAGIAECLHTNGHLADGEDCTLIGLKRCLRDSRVERSDAEQVDALASWANTCMHHNDAERGRCWRVCPVCITSERDQLRAEVERLRSDRDCEKRLRKDADEFREDAIARADSAEAECLEQARLLGKGAEREADLLGKVGRLEKDNAILKKKYNILFQYMTDANVEMHKAIMDALEVDAYPRMYLNE